MNHFHGMTVRANCNQIMRAFHTAPIVHTEKWQGIDIKKAPAGATKELLNVTVEFDMARVERLNYWRDDVMPNLPWADNHFEERVCGSPINPGIEWANWPDGKSAERFLDQRGQFNHNYMERYWPRHAGQYPTAARTPQEWWAAFELQSRADPPGYGGDPHFGIRGPYGDLDNLVNLLVSEPLTRQAWIPIFFPEDTGDANPGRKPCTLGYQFIVRDERMHVFYPLRSCDFHKHFRDDIYLTIRLALWVIQECRKRSGVWDSISLGRFHMHCTSLHLFINDYIELGGKP